MKKSVVLLGAVCGLSGLASAVDMTGFACDGGKLERVGTGVSATTTQTGRPAHFTAPIPAPDAERAAFVRFRVEENEFTCRCLSVSAGEVSLMGFVSVKPGLWTVPYAGWTGAAGKLDLALTGDREFAGLRLSEVEVVPFAEPTSVRLRARRPDGREIPFGGTVGKGDVLTVEMPLKDSADNLSLSFFRVVHLPAKTVWDVDRHNLDYLELPGAPTSLAPSPENPLVCRATLAVPDLPKACRLEAGRLVAAVHYYGGDSHDNGLFYGVAPYAFDFGEDAAAARERAAVRIFDFGPTSSEVMSGAEGVTERDVPDGFRWIERPVEFAATDIRQLDALTHDWACVRGKPEMSFALKLPKGRYAVAAGFGAIGRSCFQNHLYLPTGAEVLVDGKKVFEHVPGDRKSEWFRFLDHEAREDEDVYGTYVKPLLVDARFEVESSGGEVTFALRPPAGAPSVSIDYLCLWPVGESVGEKRLQSILAGRRIRFDAFWSRIQEVPLQVAPLNAVKPADLPSAPLALIARESPMEFVYPNTLPHVSEPGRPLVAAATPGERYGHTVMLCANADLKGVELTARGLPPSVRVTPLKAMIHRAAHNFTKAMRLGPNHLRPGARDVEKGKRYGWYVRFDVADDCKPGVYRGELVAKAADATSASLPVEFEVCPVRLPKLMDHRIAENGGGDGTPPHLRAGREILGCNSFTPVLRFTEGSIDFTRGADGRINGVTTLGGISPQELGARFKMAKEMGYDFPAPYVSLMPMNHRAPFRMGKIEPHTPDYVDAIRVAYSTLLAVARSNGYETVTLDLGGEMGHGDNYPPEKTLQEAVWLFKTIKEQVPEMLLSYRCNCKATVERFYPVLDVVGVRGRKSWDAADRLSDFGRNKPVYTYSVGGRYENGIASWYHGATGNYREWLGIVHHHELNDFICQAHCGGSRHCELVMGPDGEWLPTVRGEAWRAAIDDRRYLRLLEESLASCSSTSIRRQAEDFLAFLRQNLRATRREERNPAFGAYHGDGDLPWPCLRLDLVREICVKLTRQLRGERLPALPAFVPSTRSDLEFALDDGPFNRPDEKGITGRFEVAVGSPEETAAAEVRILQDGKAVRTVPVGPSSLTYVPRGAGLSPRRHFIFDATGLKSGAYRVALFVGGECRAEEPLVLVER